MHLKAIQQIITDHAAVILYFSAPQCHVCHVLKPKLFEAIHENFETFEALSIDIAITPDISAHYEVFTAPTIIIFLEGKEFLRKSRNMSVHEVINAIRRPYEIMHS